MTDVLVFADSIRSPEMRHEVPLAVPDAFLYAETGAGRFVIVGSLELPRLRALGADLEPLALEELGADELLAEGVLDQQEVLHEIAVRACRRLGIESAIVPGGFPLDLADRLRAAGIEVRADRRAFEARRRVKTAAELAGVRRAQAAAAAGMDAARSLLARAEVADGGVVLGGATLTSERLREAIQAAVAARGASAEELIVSHGPQTAIGHELGSGALEPGEPIVIDLWPRDRVSACFADMTRTYVVGEPAEELVEYHRLCLRAIEEAVAGVRPGTNGRDLHRAVSALFEEAGYPTQFSKEPGTVLQDGFFHGLGHGVGLEVHEAPRMGRAGDALVAGDVVAVEPGLYRAGFGGCRLEDTLLVTEDGAENLSGYPYGLAP